MMFKNSCFEHRAKKFNSLYIDRFFSLKCAADLLICKVFPDAKEVTESFAAYEAVIKYLPIDLSDKSVNLVCVGDGSSPRTAATFAFRSAWKCFSIDQNLKNKNSFNSIKRLQLSSSKIEDVKFIFNTTTIICLVHDHSPINKCLENIIAPVRHLVSIPCCVAVKGLRKPDFEYDDLNIWSPKNKVMVWRNI